MSPRKTPDQDPAEKDGEPMKLLGDGRVADSASRLQNGE